MQHSYHVYDPYSKSTEQAARIQMSGHRQLYDEALTILAAMKGEQRIVQTKSGLKTCRPIVAVKQPKNIKAVCVVNRQNPIDVRWLDLTTNTAEHRVMEILEGPWCLGTDEEEAAAIEYSKKKGEEIRAQDEKMLTGPANRAVNQVLDVMKSVAATATATAVSAMADAKEVKGKKAVTA